MRTAKGLRVIIRPDTGSLTIEGTVAGVRVRQRASTDSVASAWEEAAVITKQILNNKWHGEKVGSRSLQDAIKLYLTTEPRRPQIERLYERILKAIGEKPVPLADITQSWVNDLKPKMMAADAKPTSIARTIIAPLKAVMNLACEQEGWCAPPRFRAPKGKKGEGKRTEFYTPAEALRLMEAAEPHFRLALLGYFCTGMRHTELLTLDWADVNLAGKTITVRPELAKSGTERVAAIVPALMAALSAVPVAERQGAVIRNRAGKPYLAYTNRFRSFPERGKDRQKGGIEHALDGAIARAGVKRLTCHHLRHSWASWWYAANGHDLLGLKKEGGWGTVSMVERYAHPHLVGHEDEIKAFWHVGDTAPALMSLVS